MASLKQNVLKTLSSSHVKWINFAFADRMLSPILYWSLYGLVDNNTITCEVDPSLNDIAFYDVTNDKLIASTGYGETYFYQQALLIHECSHAILDHYYNNRDMNNKKSGGITVLADETIAYLAQAFYIVASKGNYPSNSSNPDYQAVALVRPKLEELMKNGWTGCDTMYFTAKDVVELQKAIKAHDAYKNDYATIAVHDGAKKKS
jgi:hypothetical protein